MRITRHSANNAYYPHSITILRLDRPQVVQAGAEMPWLLGLLPEGHRNERVGVSATLADLVTQLAAAESVGDHALANDLRGRIAIAAAAPQNPPPHPVIQAAQLEEDVAHNVRESIALLSTVRRSDVRRLAVERADPQGREAAPIQTALEHLGIRKIELAEDLPVVTAVFGYTRRSEDPDYQEGNAAQRYPTTLRPFPTLDDDAARALARPQAAGTIPVLAREGTHEGLAIYLDPQAVLDWLESLGFRIPGDSVQTRLTAMLEQLEPVEKYYDNIWSLPVRRVVYGLLHTASHCAMRALGRTAGLEETSVGEYLFLPLLCTVVYSTTSNHLGGVRATARDRMFEFLETLQSEATRCMYDPDCIERAGACHGCIYVPELGCRAFNHGLSRALLLGGRLPWATDADRGRLQGYWPFLANRRVLV
jgi:hypothetical protein